MPTASRVEDSTPGTAGPPGFRYLPEFVSEAEERALIAWIEAQRFDPVRMHGVVARREVIHYGWSYGFDSARIQPGTPIPQALLPLRARVAALLEDRPERFEEALVTRYPPGAGIGWHRDAPAFGTNVVGISLGAPGTLRFRRGREGRADFVQVLAPRSLYVIGGEARNAWQHTLSPLKALRYSVTFRTLRSHARAEPGPPPGTG